MKSNLIKICMIGLFTLNLAACNDFDNPEIEYEEAPEAPVRPEAPHIDPSWDLEPMIDEGQQSPNVFVYKDKKYDALFTRTLGWNGGDGVLTTALPDGNIYWTFNDSFYGTVDGPTRTRYSGSRSSFPRNSVMIQTGESGDEDLIWLADYVQTDNPDAERYYTARTHLRHPMARLSEAEIARGDIDQDYVYWAGDATVYDDPGRGSVLQMLWIGVDLTQGNGSMINFSSCLREYCLDGTPGDGRYMSELSCNHSFGSDGYGYGATMYEDKKEGHVYLYTTKQEGFSSRVLVARTETLDLRSTWSYYIRDLNGDYHWQTALPTEEEQIRSYITPHSGSMPWVFEHEGKYYMTMQSFPFGRGIYIYRSDNPYGPFNERQLLFTLPPTLDKIGNPYHQRWYMINLHPALSREGELVFSTNSDPNNFWDNFEREGSADFYRPYFFRVFGWEHAFDQE